MSRYKKMTMRTDEDMVAKDRLESTVSASVRIDIIDLAKFCEGMENKGIQFRSVSQAVSSALTSVVELMNQSGFIERKDVELSTAWEWLSQAGLIQQQMIHGRGRGIGRTMMIQALRNQGAQDEEIVQQFGKSFAQTKRAHLPINVLEGATTVNNKRKSQFEFEQSRKDEFRAWFNELELEEKTKLVNDRNYSGEVYHETWDHYEDDGEQQTLIDWNERLEAFQLFILGAMHAWKMIDSMKEYIDADGMINPPSTFFEEQARTIAEVEKANKEYAEKFAQEQAKKALGKEEKRKAKELLKLNEKIANAEQEHHAIVNKLRKDETTTGAD